MGSFFRKFSRTEVTTRKYVMIILLRPYISTKVLVHWREFTAKRS